MGQSKKRRACPVVNRDITAAECGENRHSRYACPEACPFNPFAAASYTGLLEAESALDSSTLKRLVADVPGARERILAAQRANAGHGWHAATVWEIFFQRDDQGITFAERWAQAGLAGLKNDERVLFRGKMQLRIVLLEVHRILDAERFEAVDLLDPDGPSRIFVDRSVGSRAARFTTFLTWAYPLPHGWKMSGTGIGIAEIGPFTAVEMIEACLAHLGGPAERGAKLRWLAENFVRIDDALAATGLERRRQMLAGLDASWVVATYELRVPLGTARATLAGAPGVVEEPLTKEDEAQGFLHAMVWLDDRQTPGQQVADAAAGRVVLGRVVLGPKEWRVQGIGAARVARLRVLFEGRMGGEVAFSRERQDDLGGRMSAKDPAPNLALVPPHLLEQPSAHEFSSSHVPAPPPGVSMKDHLARILADYRKSWTDSALPALGGLSPRAAARDPALRPILIELVKRQVRQVDEQNLKSGRSDDINTLIRDLGLAEIDIPPPPPRPRLPSETGVDRDEDDGTDDDDDSGPMPGPPAALRPAAPRLDGPPFTADDANERLAQVVREFDRAGDAMRELQASGATMLDDLSALTGPLLKDNEFNFLVVFAYQAWFALVPCGVRAPTLDYRAMETELFAVFERLRSSGPGATGIYDIVRDGCRQPELLAAVTRRIVSGALRAPKDIAPARESTLVMTIVLKILINELDRALRRP